MRSSRVQLMRVSNNAEQVYIRTFEQMMDRLSMKIGSLFVI